jgi:hypothetical protein
MFDREKYRQKALSILTPIKPADNNTLAPKSFLFNASRCYTQSSLPEYYLIYFLFHDLLEFKDLGRFEKLAWSFPIDYYGRAFLIEYRKFGVGVFVQDIEKDRIHAEEIVKKIRSAVKSASPFYDHIAEEAVKNSKFSILNNNDSLYARFKYLLTLYKQEYSKYIENKDKNKTEKKVFPQCTMISSTNLGAQHYVTANWIAISCIEAFFSWTEHIFIHLAVIAQDVSDGETVSKLIGAEWKIKFKAAIKDDSIEAKKFFDELNIVRSQLRNFVSHGAFGKDGNAFNFHSGTGAVPVLMNHKRQNNRFSLNGNLTFKEEEVIKLIEEFIEFLWKGSLYPSMYYTQSCGLPTLLTLASSGMYEVLRTDIESMKQYCEHLINEFDNALNMDW